MCLYFMTIKHRHNLRGICGQSFGCLKSQFRSKLSCMAVSIPKIIGEALPYISCISWVLWRPTCFCGSCAAASEPAKCTVIKLQCQHHLDLAEEWKTNLMSLAILFHFLCAQHVSDINISIFRSLRLCWWITTSVVLFSVRCVLQFLLRLVFGGVRFAGLLFYFTYVLNMFRTLIYPSSGACNCVDELPHWSSCSQFVVCWSFVRLVLGGVRVAGFSLQNEHHPKPAVPKLQHTMNWEQDDQCGNSSTQSQAPEDGYINVRNMLST